MQRSTSTHLVIPGLVLATFASAPAFAQWLPPETLSTPRFGHSALTVGDYALFAGGEPGGFQPAVSSIDVYDASSGTWSGASLVVARGYMAETVVGDLAIFAGGIAPQGHKTAFIDVYDSAAGPPSDPLAWSVADLSVPRGNLAAATVGTKAMFAGGVTGGAGATTPTDVVDIYDASLGLPLSDPAAWSTAHLSVARSQVVATTVGTRILFAGGFADFGGPTGDKQGLDVVDVYDDATGLWSTANLSTGRASVAAVTAGKRAYFAGGLPLAGQPSAGSDVVDVYDATIGPPSDPSAWSVLHLSVPRQGLAAAAVGGRVLFAGGAQNITTMSKTVDVLDAASVTWEPTTQLLLARFNLAAAKVHGKVLFAGGAVPDASGFPISTTLIDVYEPCPGAPASEVVRLGTPPNPNAFLPGVTSGPVIGATWDPVIDHTAFVQGAILDFLAIGLAATEIPSPYGTILCGLNPALIVTSAPGTPFALPIPAVCTHVGVLLPTQGGSLDAGLQVALTNALDVTIGTY